MQLPADYYPLMIATLVPKNDGLRLIMPNEEYDLGSDYVSEIWQIVAECQGQQSLPQICKKLSISVGEELARKLIEDFAQLGAIIDSRHFFEYFHRVSSNLQTYASHRSDEEILRNHDSERIPPKVGKRIGLPKPQGTIVALAELRKSVRVFGDEEVSLEAISSILKGAYGKSKSGHFAVPSAGGLYPMRIFMIVAKEQKDLPIGIYEYDNFNSLILFDDHPDFESLSYALNCKGTPFSAPIVFVITGDKERQSFKYSNMAYKFMAMEAGAISQAITLGAIEHGYSTCELGALFDEPILQELRLEGQMSFVAIAFGRESDAAYQNPWIETAKVRDALVGDGLPVSGVQMVGYSEDYEQRYFQYVAFSKGETISKGISTAESEAMLKAIAEAYERDIAGKIRWDVNCTLEELQGKYPNCTALRPNELLPLSDEQYDNFDFIGRYSADADPVQWIRGVSLADSTKTVFVPIESVFYPVNEKLIGRKPFAKTCSSGFAVHKTRVEAIRSAVLELVERDCLMRVWLKKEPCSVIPVNEWPEYLIRRRSFWAQHGRHVRLLDISHHGIAACLAIIDGGDYPCFVSGAAATDKADDANCLIKAFQEAESRLIYGLNYPVRRILWPKDVRDVLDHELLYAQSSEYHDALDFLFESGEQKRWTRPTATLHDLAKELNIVIVDLTEKASPLFAVKAISPKLVPITFGYGMECWTHPSLSLKEKPTMPHFFA